MQADTEEKIAAMKSAISEERNSKKLCQNEIEKLKLIIENHIKMKKEWKLTLFDMGKKLEDKLQELYKLKTNQVI